METQEVIHKQGQPLKVLLQKTREGYNWEIHIQGEDIAEILPELSGSAAASGLAAATDRHYQKMKPPRSQTC
jgi:hypothetical protein